MPPLAASSLEAVQDRSPKASAMVERLVEATLVEIAERGLAATTIRSIAARAGVSQGAIFAHFPTRAALVAETAREVNRRQEAQLAEVDFSHSPEPLADIMRLLRSMCRSPLNLIWYELVIAARTSDEFRAATTDVLTAHRAATTSAGVDLMRALMPDRDVGEIAALVHAVVAMFDGEAIASFAGADPVTEGLMERALMIVGVPIISAPTN